MENILEQNPVISIGSNNKIYLGGEDLLKRLSSSTPDKKNRAMQIDNDKPTDEKDKRPHSYKQRGEVFNIVHADDVDINNINLASEYKVEIRYLKKIIESKDEHLSSTIKEYKHIIDTKNEEIRLLKSLLEKK